MTVVAACHHSDVQINPNPKIPNSTRWIGTLSSPPNLAGAVQIRGSAWMAPPVASDSGQTVVSVSISNAAAGGVHPWAVHQGTCGNDQGMFGEGSNYAPLRVNSDGTASAKTTLRDATPKSGNYFVEVLASPSNTGTVIACGNLAPPSA